jgi:hypothetical protein
MDAEKLTITADGQGNFACKSGDEADEKGENQTFTSVDQVVQWVQQELSEDESSDPAQAQVSPDGQAMWNQEAAKRQAAAQQQQAM